MNNFVDNALWDSSLFTVRLHSQTLESSQTCRPDLLPNKKENSGSGTGILQHRTAPHEKRE